MILNKWICFIKTFIRSFPWFYGNAVDGCDYVDEEYRKGCNVVISKCEICGKYDISWSGGYKVDKL